MPYVIRNGLAYWEDDFPTEEDTAEEPVLVQVPREEIDDYKKLEASSFECGECGREYKTRSGLDKHLTSKH